MPSLWPKFLALGMPKEIQLPNVGRIMYFRDEPSFQLAPRASREFEIHWVTHGLLTPVCGGESMELRAGDWMLTPPGKRYGFKINAGQSFSCFHAHFTWPEVRVLERQNPRSWPLAAWSNVRDQNRLAAEMMELIRLQRSRRAGHTWAVSAGLLSILHRISADLDGGRKQDERTAHAVPVSRAIDFIESHLHQAIALDEVATHLDLNPAYLARLFKTGMGESVGQFVTRRKVELARERMLTTRMNIKAVANSLGFRDVAYFSRVFKKVTGHSPRAFEARGAR